MKWTLALVLAMVATSAAAQDEPRFCPNRPSLGASGCTTEPGQVQLEWSAFDWERDDSSDGREDSMLAADVLARFGIGPSTELQLGWAPLGRVRTRDAITGAVDTVRGVSDVRIGVRQALGPPDAKGWSLGVEPFVTAPVGKTPIGAGTWGAGVVLPATYDIAEGWQLAFTGEMDASPDEDGAGRHFAYSGIVGLGYDLSDSVTLVGEVMAERDNDPMEHQTHLATAASVAWQPGKRFQLDLLAVAGLNRNTPDVRLVTGGAILF